MIELKAELFQDLTSLEGVRTGLQNAVRLEHATIPTYLYALYSLKQGANHEIVSLVGGIVAEEMAHLALAANVLNAIGGTPLIDDPSLLPAYPGPLPGGVDGGLQVRLRPFSIDVVQDMFMVIEHPEHPLEFPRAAAEVQQKTIGTFYAQISKSIGELGEGIFTGDPAKQVSQGFAAVEVTSVTDVASAQHAIEIIVEQGEGTNTSPVDPEGRPGDLAHYYRFQEIAEGRQLVPNPHAGPDTPPDERWSFTGPPIPFDAGGVLPLVSDPKVNVSDPTGPPTYAVGTTARRLCDTFNYTYTSLLRGLHATFNSRPETLPAAIGLMWSLEQQFIEMAQFPADPSLPDGPRAAPSFEYQPTNPG
jgi:rubrerythrin